MDTLCFSFWTTGCDMLQKLSSEGICITCWSKEWSQVEANLSFKRLVEIEFKSHILAFTSVMTALSRKTVRTEPGFMIQAIHCRAKWVITSDHLERIFVALSYRMRKNLYLAPRFPCGNLGVMVFEAFRKLKIQTFWIFSSVPWHLRCGCYTSSGLKKRSSPSLLSLVRGRLRSAERLVSYR